MFRHIVQKVPRSWMILTLMGVLLLSGGASERACAFTSADSDTAVNAYLNAFSLPNGSAAFIQGDQNGGDPGFWQEIEEIEGIEDANNRTGGAYNSQVTALLNGFNNAHGTDWSNNMYNDDISWATIAYTRAYQATGNTTFRTIAKNNFDMMFARAWDPAQGALYWTTDNNSYNSCIECPAGIAAYLLYQALGDSSYLTKAQNLFSWEKTHLYNTSTGAVLDAVSTSGSVGTWASTYNQGTFVGLANYLGDTTNAKKAADYTMDCMGDYTTTGYRIMPQYGSGGDNNSGLNSIGLRWISKFMKDRSLQSTYLGWLQANADTAWNVRRTSDNLSWCQWQQQTPTGVMHSWDCINSVVALQVVPASNTAPKPYFMLVNQSSGKVLDLIGGNTSNGASTNQWSYDYNSAEQRWALLPTENGDHFMIVSWVSGKALCPSQDSTSTGAQMYQWDYTGNNPSQQWDLVDAGNGWYNLRNVRSGLSLDNLNSTADNGEVTQWTPNTSTAQKWRLQPWGNYFVRADSGKYICVQSEGRSNSNPLLHSTTIRSTVVQYTQENNPWFQWQFVSEGDGFYGLFNLNATNRVLCVQNGSTAPGYNTHLWDYNPNNVGDQKIRITPLTNGKFKFYFGHDGMSWNIPGGSTANNTKLQQYPDNSYPWQQFSLERAQ